MACVILLINVIKTIRKYDYLAAHNIITVDLHFK